ncbi:MAG: hypothetical protein H0W68_12285, partial [Gemmatimonadaceae bacterium]|nr:hypothetical protein [Gemmatimonadaceae bacterium]
MTRRWLRKTAALGLCLLASTRAGAQENAGDVGLARALVATESVTVAWNRAIRVSRSMPTLQVVVMPQLRRGSAIHARAWAALRELGASHVRFVPWVPYPRLAVAELEPPVTGSPSWNASLIDPIVADFAAAMERR